MEIETKKFINRFILIGLFLLSSVSESYGNQDNTRLLFVGEDQDVLSIASGREESAWQAPAIALVIEQSDFRQTLDHSLDEVINALPGFHVVETVSGIRSYLRGIPQSTLYLYDTVPMNFSADMPLHSIKRVEVVRGPGSVLWGPDAFAGIVNVVPLTGKDQTGTETGMLVSTEDKSAGGYINHGWDTYEWDGFVSLSASMAEKDDFSSDITRFWGNESLPVPVEDRRGDRSGDHGHQLELSGNFAFNDFFKISGRLVDTLDHYTLSDQLKQVTWKEVKEETKGFIKLEGKKRLGIDSAFRFTGTVSLIDTEKRVADTDLDNDKYETYGEITYEKVFNSGRSHFTSGISYRNIRHNGVAIWDTYFPDFLVDENEEFLPTFTQENYATQLYSIFTQYRMTIGKVDLNFGVRYDEHDSFEDNLSYNTSLVWTPLEDWVFKALTGTAYRTPSPRQLFVKNKTYLEEIRNFSVEVSRKIGKKAEISVCGFINDIDNHFMDIPYDGISNPNSQEVKGIELSGFFRLHPDLTLSGSFTLLENNGPLESFLNLDYSILLPDGTLQNHYTQFDYPYNSGPDKFWKLGLVWTPEKNTGIFIRAEYFSEYPFSAPFVQEEGAADSAWIMDAGIRIKHFLSTNVDFEIKVKNLLDTDYLVSGEYSLEKGKPFSIEITWRKTW